MTLRGFTGIPHSALYIRTWPTGAFRELHYQSFCSILDTTEHDTAMVHAFNNEVISEIRKDLPGFKKFTTLQMAVQLNTKIGKLCEHLPSRG